MAIIQQIQQKTGCLFLVILGSLLLFVISDLIKSDGGGIFGNGGLHVGEIRGEKVSYEEFNTRLNGMLATLEQNNPGVKIDESTKTQYSEQAWNSFLQDKIFAVEYSNLGIQVSPEELADMTIGDHPDEQVIKAFTAQGGQFDKNRLIKFLQEDMEADEAKKASWVQFEEGLTQNVLGRKYAALVKGSCYTTKIEAKVQFEETRNSLTGNFVGLQYATIPDASVKVTDEELKKELNANKEKYKQEASRDIEFVTFSIEPTSEDSAATKIWANENFEKLRLSKYDSAFVNIMNSENPWDGAFKPLGSFDKDLEPQLFALDSGGMIGPLYKDGKYTIYKISDTKRDTQVIFKASHILIPINGQTKADSIAAQTRATTLMGELMSGKTTFESASMMNPDGTGQVAGDLGYISKTSSNVSKEFYQNALFANQGQLFVVNDPSGIHIGKVTSPKSDKVIKVAILSQSITSGRNTIRTASTKANEFLSIARTAKDFGKAAESKGLTKRVAYTVKENDIAIAGISDPKQMIRWLYDEKTEKNPVSEIMSFSTNYIIAKCTKVKKEGVPDIEEIRPTLELAVRNTKKADQLEAKFKAALKKSKNMDQLAKNLNSIAMLIPEQNFSVDNVPGVGYDLKVLGTLFGVPTNKFSPIVRGENGVYVVWVSTINKPQAPANYDELQKTAIDQVKATVDAGVMDALRKKAEIKDYRYKYF
ncbi:MAG: peptidylprolyl isomerase [Bacteroidia bacterium]